MVNCTKGVSRRHSSKNKIEFRVSNSQLTLPEVKSLWCLFHFVFTLCQPKKSCSRLYPVPQIPPPFSFSSVCKSLHFLRFISITFPLTFWIVCDAKWFSQGCLGLSSCHHCNFCGFTLLFFPFCIKEGSSEDMSLGNLENVYDVIVFRLPFRFFTSLVCQSTRRVIWIMQIYFCPRFCSNHRVGGSLRL